MTWHNKILHGIILLDELDTSGKLMQHLTKNMEKEVADANEIEFQEGKIQILKFQRVKFKHLQTKGIVCNLAIYKQLEILESVE